MASFKYEVGTLTTIASTELNSLANGARTLGVEYDNSLTSNLFLWADFELNVSFGSAPTADTLVELYLVPALDGASYADGDASVQPPMTLYVGGFPVRAVTTAQKIVLRGVPFSPTKFKAVVKNAVGVAFPASGSTLKMLPYREQV